MSIRSNGALLCGLIGSLFFGYIFFSGNETQELRAEGLDSQVFAPHDLAPPSQELSSQVTPSVDVLGPTDRATAQPQVNAIAVSLSEEFWDPDDVNSGVAREPNSVGDPLDPEGDASANFSTTIKFVGEFLDPEEAFPLDVIAQPQKFIGGESDPEGQDYSYADGAGFVGEDKDPERDQP